VVEWEAPLDASPSTIRPDDVKHVTCDEELLEEWEEQPVQWAVLQEVVDQLVHQEEEMLVEV